MNGRSVLFPKDDGRVDWEGRERVLLFKYRCRTLGLLSTKRRLTDDDLSQMRSQWVRQRWHCERKAALPLPCVRVSSYGPPSNARPWSCTWKGSGSGPLVACSTVAMWPSTPGSKRLGNRLTPCAQLPVWP